MKKIIITRKLPLKVEKTLQEKYDVILNTQDKPFSPEQMQGALNSCDALIPTVSDSLPSEIFSKKIQTKIIANYGVGFNHIDLKSCKKYGIKVSNTPNVLTDCTADLTMALLLASARRLSEAERTLRSGNWQGWKPTDFLSTSVTNKTLGIIGLGRIGKAVARRAYNGFNMKIIFSSRRKVDKNELKDFNAIQVESIEEVFSQADFVSLHCPGGKDTKNLVNKKRIKLMPKHSILINTSRGDVVQENALISALKNKEIAGAGLDVYKNEPNFNPKFLEVANLTLLPHLGSNSVETRTAMGMCVVKNLDSFFNNQNIPNQVV